jgi:hypothetical protein
MIRGEQWPAGQSRSRVAVATVASFARLISWRSGEYPKRQNILQEVEVLVRNSQRGICLHSEDPLFYGRADWGSFDVNDSADWSWYYYDAREIDPSKALFFERHHATLICFGIACLIQLACLSVNLSSSSSSWSILSFSISDKTPSSEPGIVADTFSKVSLKPFFIN